MRCSSSWQSNNRQQSKRRKQIRVERLTERFCEYRAMREQMQAIMQQILSHDALNRLNNIRVVKPEKALKLEQLIMQNAQRGTFQGKVSEQQLVGLLEQVGEMEKENVLKVEIKKHRFDDEDELDIDALDL